MQKLPDSIFSLASSPALRRHASAGDLIPLPQSRSSRPEPPLADALDLASPRIAPDGSRRYLEEPRLAWPRANGQTSKPAPQTNHVDYGEASQWLRKHPSEEGRNIAKSILRNIQRIPNELLEIELLLAHGANDAAKVHCIEMTHLSELLRLPELAAYAIGTQVAFDLDDTLFNVAEASAVLANLQASHTCFGLTARGYREAFETWCSLQEAGLHLGKSAPWSDLRTPSLPRSGYLDGVIYGSEENMKGDFLGFICRDNPDLKHLVFVDDSPRNFVAMAQAVANLPNGPTLTCVWFTGALGRSSQKSRRELWSTFCQAVEAKDRNQLVTLETKVRHSPCSQMPDRDRAAVPLADLLKRIITKDNAPLSERLKEFNDGVGVIAGARPWVKEAATLALTRHQGASGAVPELLPSN